MNIHWSCDHFALAESTYNQTPVIIHAMISAVNVKDAKKFIVVNAVSVHHLNKRADRIVLWVNSWEYKSKEIDYIIDLFIVKQVQNIDNNKPLKGQTYFDPSYHSRFKFFGQEDIRWDNGVFQVVKYWSVVLTLLNILVIQQKLPMHHHFGTVQHGGFYQDTKTIVDKA